MPQWVALLRAVNVSGRNTLKMADLREACGAAGFRDVRTYVQSGNLVLEGAQRSAAKVAGTIEQTLRDSFDLDVAVLVRSAAQWAAVIQDRPTFGSGDVANLYVAFMNQTVSPSRAEALSEVRGADAYAVAGSELYLDLVSGAARTKLTNAAIEKKLGVVSTSRNWRTVGRIQEMLAGS